MKSISRGARLDSREQQQLAVEGYVLRRGLFSRAEVAEIADACERLVDDVVTGYQGHRLSLGSYTFDPDFERLVMIKWEGASDVVHGLEPFAHLSPELEAWTRDERFIAPMRDLCGHEAPALFTEKLNLKRAGDGGPNPFHQDYPYWTDSTPRAADIATAILFLDDAHLGNGCLRVVPGSHLNGTWKGRTDGDSLMANEIDLDTVADIEGTPLEVEAGSVVYFGAFLVHCSAPNTSDADRRALLFSYQPPVEPCPTQADLLRQLGESVGAIPRP